MGPLLAAGGDIWSKAGSAVYNIPLLDPEAKVANAAIGDKEVYPGASSYTATIRLLSPSQLKGVFKEISFHPIEGKPSIVPEYTRFKALKGIQSEVPEKAALLVLAI